MERINVAGFAAAVSENFEALEGAAREGTPGDAPTTARRVFVWRPDGLAGVTVLRIENNSTLAASHTHRHSVGVIYEGAFDWWYRRETVTLRKGALKLKEPGEVYRDRRIHAPFTLQEVTFSPETMNEAAAALGLSAPIGFRRLEHEARPRATRLAFELHDALANGAPILETQVRLAEALAEILTTCTEPRSRTEASRTVSRAREYLHDAMTKKVMLDELAAHVGLDKYHLVRSFRTEVGIPPYEYLTRIRIARARELLARGWIAARVAREVGLYDESQLHRHFRRIVGVSPGRYARAVSPRWRICQDRPCGEEHETSSFPV